MYILQLKIIIRPTFTALYYPTIMIQNLKCKNEQQKALKKLGTQASGERRPRICCNCHVQMLIVAWYLGRGSICQMLKNVKNDDHAEQWLPWEANRKHVHRKQVNKHETYRRTMCKHSALSVPHLGCDQHSRGPAYSCSPRAISGLHQTGTLPEACTGRPAHSLTSGLHRRQSFPFSDVF